MYSMLCLCFFLACFARTFHLKLQNTLQCFTETHSISDFVLMSIISNTKRNFENTEKDF